MVKGLGRGTCGLGLEGPGLGLGLGLEGPGLGLGLGLEILALTTSLQASCQPSDTSIPLDKTVENDSLIPLPFHCQCITGETC